MEGLSQKEINAVRGAYKNSGSLREVGRKFNRSQNTIKKYVIDYYAVKTKNFVTNVKTKDEALIGTYIGLWLGDGTQYRDKTSYTTKICSNKNDKLLNSFVCNLLCIIFGVTTRLIEEKNSNRAYIRFQSKFVFNYIYNYVRVNGVKTYSVRLKESVSSYSNSFLKGCLLGLALSDGSLKNKFVFGVASEGLALNMKEILLRFQFNPSMQVVNRPKKATFYVISLNPKESLRLQEFLSSIIRRAGFKQSFYELKYGPVRTF